MLLMALVLITLSNAGGKGILYGGCVFVSITTHYFTLVAIMWMGAEATLMFQKVVFVFAQITKKQVVIVSLICWCELVN